MKLYIMISFKMVDFKIFYKVTLRSPVISISVYMCLSLPVYILYIYLIINLSICLPIYISISTFLAIYSIHLSVLSISPSIYPYDKMLLMHNPYTTGHVLPLPLCSIKIHVQINQGNVFSPPAVCQAKNTTPLPPSSASLALSTPRHFQ